MAGYKLAKVAPDARGNLEPRRPAREGTDRTAGLMLTNPSNGPLRRGIEEVADIFHGAGALLYYDGANLTPSLAALDQATWASTSSHQPPQDVFAAARGRGARWRPDRGTGNDRAVPPSPQVVRDA